LPRAEQWVVASWLTAALRSRSTQRGSLLACRQAESHWRRELRAFGPTPKSRAFALQTDGAGAGSLSVWGSRGGGQCVESSFDAIDHEWVVKFVEHRIADQRVVRLIRKWLNAGVLEEGQRVEVTEGTPQGGVVSPLLANIYLHYVFDLWAAQWRRKQASGDVIIVRYADDIVVGFQNWHDAERFQEELRERFAKFNLELHPDKTRLIEFGRFAASNRKERGEGKPETFDFLGFTHICATTSKGWFQVKRRTIRKRLRAKLQAVKTALRRRMHRPVPETGVWLGAVITGHARYYGVPGNMQSLRQFRDEVSRHWRRTLARRSQKGGLPWTRMQRLIKRWLPPLRICHPNPSQRLVVIT
jgi:RNA-directed DNA polymerase